jgi:lipopolysaccharide biosynthesis protein
MTDSRRLGVFAHFDRHNEVADYVIYSLKKLAEHVDDLVFVTTSQLVVEDRNRLEEICKKVICRENAGLDLYSHRVGLASVNYIQYQEVVLLNDSVYGPLNDLGQLFSSMSAKSYDVWGISDCYDIAYHIQSYFLVFTERVVQSAVFENFWKSMVANPEKSSIIQDYEVGLTQLLIENGYKCGVLCPSKKMGTVERVVRYRRHYWNMFRERWNDPALYYSLLSGLGKKASMNPSHYEWRTMLLSSRSAYLKVNLLRDNPEALPDIDAILPLISVHTEYPSDLIRQHLSRMQS